MKDIKDSPKEREAQTLSEVTKDVESRLALLRSSWLNPDAFLVASSVTCPVNVPIAVKKQPAISLSARVVQVLKTGPMSPTSHRP